MTDEKWAIIIMRKVNRFWEKCIILHSLSITYGHYLTQMLTILEINSQNLAKLRVQKSQSAKFYLSLISATEILSGIHDNTW